MLVAVRAARDWHTSARSTATTRSRVEAALRKARETGIPTVVHCVTRKGLGYLAAETDEADRMHAVGPVPAPDAASRPTWTDVFAAEMLAVGACPARCRGVVGGDVRSDRAAAVRIGVPVPRF